MKKARKQSVQGQILICWQSQEQNHEYKPTKPDSTLALHWVSLHQLQSLLDALC